MSGILWCPDFHGRIIRNSHAMLVYSSQESLLFMDAGELGGGDCSSS